VGDGKHDDRTVAGIVFDTENDGAGPIFQTFFEAPLEFGFPKIGVPDHLAGLRARERQALLIQFVIELCRFSGRFRLSDQCQILIGEILCREHFTVAALEAVVFFGRNHYRAFASVAGDRNGLGKRNI